MKIGRWRRFRPTVRGGLQDPTAFEPQSLYAEARGIVDQAMRQVRRDRSNRHSLKRTIEAAKLLRRHDTHDAAHLLALLLLQTPSAARAQDEMDSHHGGYKNRQARLFELIDFNDTFVDTVLALEDSELATFSERLRTEMDVLTQNYNLLGFTDKQYDAITHGLSREIAVYRGARKEGYIARMTSRVQDAKGIDMVITDPKTKKSINIDCKTRSAYHFRLVDLQHQKRVDEEKRLRCELAGYCIVQNGHGEDAISTVLLEVATNNLGEIKDFTFTDTAKLGVLLGRALEQHGRYIV